MSYKTQEMSYNLYLKENRPDRSYRDSLKGHKIGMGFFWGQFLVQGSFGVLLEALGIFLGLGFWLHSIIPVT